MKKLILLTIPFIILVLFIPLHYTSCYTIQKNGNENQEYLLLRQLVRGTFKTFTTKSMAKEVYKRQYMEHIRYGLGRHAVSAMRKKYRGSVVMQRSGRKRLYDHNVFLSSLFKGELHHRVYGNLAPRFEQGIFIDIGSGILYQEGAPTVRDIFEDKRVVTHLKLCLATDINGKSYKSNYVDRYNKQKKKLPFPVREVPMKMVHARQFITLTAGLLDKNTALIFRSSNSGPDLYYKTEFVEGHFRAMIRAYYDRDVIYFFNKFALYKAKNSVSFEVIGIIDPNVGTNHTHSVWDKMNWAKRKITQAFFPRKNLITIKIKKKK
jgi:hypothetical protein